MEMQDHTGLYKWDPGGLTVDQHTCIVHQHFHFEMVILAITVQRMSRFTFGKVHADGMYLYCIPAFQLIFQIAELYRLVADGDQRVTFLCEQFG